MLFRFWVFPDCTFLDISNISIREASYRWGVSERRVNQYCAEGRIPGASRFGRSWAIPENAEKPSDPRFQEQPRDPGRAST